MKYIPHKYQAYAIDFIEQNNIAAVLLEMGLGKTVITLTAIDNLLFDYFLVHKVLIIAPLRVARDTWPAEIVKWDHIKEISYSIVVGTLDERLNALNKRADLYIINRENVQWLINSKEFDYDMVVIDELSSFKNHQAKRFKSLMKVRPKVDRIVGLTGTPASNGLMDLWAQFKLLDMGKRLGKFITAFRNEYFVPDKRNGQIIYSYSLREGSEEKIYKAIADITISMKAKDYLTMPNLINTTFQVNLNSQETKMYRSLKKKLLIELKNVEITAANAASLSGKLSQMASGAIYDDDKNIISIHDRKLDALEDIIEAANGNPILVAYWFQHDLERIIERLSKLKLNYSTLYKAEDIEKWNKGELQIGLIHPASAGHGLNLQFGGYNLVWFSIPWSLELYQQTNARLYRQGQKSNVVVIQHIVTKGTIDEKILTALSTKDKVQSALIDAVKADIKGVLNESI